MGRADAELVEANERATLLGIGGLEMCELGYVPGATLLDSGVDIPSFNGVIATAADGADVPAVAETAAAWFAARGRPWVWRAGAGNLPADLPLRLEALGFVADDPEPGMVCEVRDALALAAAGEAGEAPVAEVGGDPDAFAGWFGVFATGFAIPLALAPALALVLRAAGRPGGPLRHFLLRDGRGGILSCGSLALGAGVAGIGNIATPPEHRGRGHGRTLTLALLRAGRAEGCDRAVLSATPRAVELYRRLGFTETGRRWIYVPPDS